MSYVPGILGGKAFYPLGLQNPYNSASPYFGDAAAQIHNYLDPYAQMGQGMIPGMQSLYGNLTNDPGGMLAKIGQGFQEQPGYKFQVAQAMGGANNAARASGMTGSPTAQMNSANIANQLANQSYNQYLQNALGLFGTGVQGQQGLFNTGFDASKMAGSDLANIYQNQAMAAYGGAQQKNQNMMDFFGGLFGRSNQSNGG